MERKLLVCQLRNTQPSSMSLPCQIWFLWCQSLKCGNTFLYLLRNDHKLMTRQELEACNCPSEVM